MKYFVVMEDWSGARIHFEGTYEECLNTLSGIYNEMVEFRALMPMEEWTPILYIEGGGTLVIGGEVLAIYRIYPSSDGEGILQALNDHRKYFS